LAQAHRCGKAKIRCPELDSSQVGLCGLVRDENQSGLRSSVMHCGKGTQQHSLVPPPSGAGDHSRGALAEPDERIAAFHPTNPLDYTVEPWISQHSDSLGGNSEVGESLGIVVRCCGRSRNHLIAGRQKGTGRPAAPSTPRTDCGAHDRYFGSRSGGTSGELRPEIQLGEDQQAGLEDSEEPVHRAWKIVGEIIGCVDRQAGRQALGRRAEVGVDDLALGKPAAQLHDDALGL
jgi:hypothetical protein